MTTSDRFSAPLQDEPKCNKGTPAILVSGSGDRGREPTIPESAVLHRMKYHFFKADPNDPEDYDDWELFAPNIDCDNCIDVLIVRADAVGVEGGGREPSPADVPGTDMGQRLAIMYAAMDYATQCALHPHASGGQVSELDAAFDKLRGLLGLLPADMALPGAGLDTGISGEGGEE